MRNEYECEFERVAVAPAADLEQLRKNVEAAINRALAQIFHQFGALQGDVYRLSYKPVRSWGR